jgi:hypothetical protein
MGAESLFCLRFLYFSSPRLVTFFFGADIYMVRALCVVYLTLQSRNTVLSAPGRHFAPLLLQKPASRGGRGWTTGRIGIPRLARTGRSRGCGR